MSYSMCLSVLTLSGTFVDSKIVPGFYYRVRRVAGGGASGDDDLLFEGEPRRLVNVGIGYGKRITFRGDDRSEEHTSELQSPVPISYAVFCLKKKKKQKKI